MFKDRGLHIALYKRIFSLSRSKFDRAGVMGSNKMHSESYARVACAFDSGMASGPSG